MGKYSTLSALLSAIADAIRSKTGGGTAIAAEDFPEAIGGIVTGGGVDTGDATATAGDILAGLRPLSVRGHGDPAVDMSLKPAGKIKF